MAADLDTLTAAAARDVTRLTRELLRREISLARWQASMQTAIADAHTAAYVAGVADRLHIRAGSAALNAKNLSAAERTTIRQAVQAQRPYLDRFVQAIRAGDLSNAQIAARASLYADSARATYWRGATAGADLPFYPGDGGTPCLGHCRCTWQQRGGAWIWVLGDAEHCDGCKTRAAGSPYAG